MEILHVAAELAPVAKVGGLADVLMGLSRALSEQGHHSRVLIPKYDTLIEEEIADFSASSDDFLCEEDGVQHKNRLWKGKVQGLEALFLETDHPKHYFDRGSLYGCEDDTARFLYFCRATIEYLRQTKHSFDVIHIHDWQCAAIIPLFRQMLQDGEAEGPRLIFTIHNIEHQGRCSPADIERIGLSGVDYSSLDKMADNYDPAVINLMKGGIVFADSVTTVSPKYAVEVMGPEGGRGLEATLYKYREKFSGIINGIDYNYWNPATDRYLPQHYEVNGGSSVADVLEKKAENRRVLRSQLKLAEEKRPLVGAVTRLVPQKGVHLIKHAIFRTLEMGGQFVLLGSSPIPEIQAEFAALKEEHKNNPNLEICLDHSEELAHLIFAGADMLIVPSLFEPCGLTQLIALHYGTVPIVRETGGLADTVVDVDYSDRPLGESNGFTFKDADTGGVNWALDRAIHCWTHEPATWKELVEAGIGTDYSWRLPAEEYVALYSKVPVA